MTRLPRPPVKRVDLTLSGHVISENFCECCGTEHCQRRWRAEPCEVIVQREMSSMPRS
jgi:hypothetical protein